MLSLDGDTWVSCVFPSNSTALFHVEGKDKNTTITAVVSPEMFEEYSLRDPTYFHDNAREEEEEGEEEEERDGLGDRETRRKYPPRSLRVRPKRMPPAQFQVHLATLYRALLCSNVFSRYSPTLVTLEYTSVEEVVIVSLLIEDEGEEEDERTERKESYDENEEEDEEKARKGRKEKRLLLSCSSSTRKRKREVRREKGEEEDQEEAMYDPFVECNGTLNKDHQGMFSMRRTGGTEGSERRGRGRKRGKSLHHRPSRELQSVLQTCPMPSTLLNLRFEDALLEGEAVVDGRVFRDIISDFSQAGCKEVVLECFPFSPNRGGNNASSGFSSSLLPGGGGRKMTSAGAGDGNHKNRHPPSDGFSFLGDLRLSGKSVDIEVIEELKGEKKLMRGEGEEEEEEMEEEEEENGDGAGGGARRRNKKGGGEYHEEKASRNTPPPPLPPRSLTPSTVSTSSLSLRRRSVKTTFSTLHLGLTAGSTGMTNTSPSAPSSFSPRVHLRVNNIGQLNVIHTKYGSGSAGSGGGGRGKGGGGRGRRNEDEAEAPHEEGNAGSTVSRTPMVTVSFVIMPRITFDDW